MRGPWAPLALTIMIPVSLACAVKIAGPFLLAIVLFTPVASMLILLGLLLLIWQGRGWGRLLAASAEVHKRRGQCPACGYDLRNLEAEVDGLVTCPECGAAWDLRPAESAGSVVVLRSARG